MTEALYLPSSNWQGRSPVLRVGNTGSTLGESIVWGSLLVMTPWSSAYGAPGYSDGNRNNSGAAPCEPQWTSDWRAIPWSCSRPRVGRRMDTTGVQAKSKIG